jgi:tripartite-type tricarboxylate transporter receptor subunit TctC
MKRSPLVCIAISWMMVATLAPAAETYPVKPVRLITPYVAGGNADIQARYMTDRLTEVLGKQFIVDNRGGAIGMIGVELAARSAPDGYTLLFVANTYTVSPSLFKKVPYDTIKDFQPITLVGETPELFIGNNSIAAKSVKEIIALARSRPGQLNYGSTGNGSPSHLAGALFELIAGVKHPLVKAGKLKAFAITTNKRSTLAPDIPTMDEAGVPGYEASIWNGVLAPAGTPKAIVNQLHETIVGILKSPQAAERYANVGAEIRYNSPEEFAVLIRTELAKWAKVIKAAGIRVDDR